MNIPLILAAWLVRLAYQTPSVDQCRLSSRKKISPLLSLPEFQTHLLIFLLTRGSCANKMCLSLKWPIYGHRLKERLPGLASATHLLRRLLLPLLLVFSVLQPSNSSGSGYLSVAQICGSCHVGQQAFQRQHKDGLSHALNCLFEGNE